MLRSESRLLDEVGRLLESSSPCIQRSAHTGESVRQPGPGLRISRRKLCFDRCQLCVCFPSCLIDAQLNLNFLLTYISLDAVNALLKFASSSLTDRFELSLQRIRLG